MKPMTTPRRRDECELLVWSQKWAMMTVNIGVVAFRIAATPDPMWVCAQTVMQDGRYGVQQANAEEQPPCLPVSWHRQA